MGRGREGEREGVMGGRTEGGRQGMREGGRMEGRELREGERGREDVMARG